MNASDALSVMAQVADKFVGTRADHVKVEEALRALHKVVSEQAPVKQEKE